MDLDGDGAPPRAHCRLKPVESAGDAWQKPGKGRGRSMAREEKSSKSDVQDLLTQVDRFLASPASKEAVSISREAIDSAVASMEKAERIDLETLKLTVTG